MEKFADIVVPVARGVFTFRVEEGMPLRPGVGVEVVMGARKRYLGIVWRLHGEAPAFRTKPVERLLTAAPLLTPLQMRLWEWVADYYLCSLGDVMRFALPAALKPAGLTEDEFRSEAYRPATVRCLRLGEGLADEEAFRAACGQLRRAPAQEALLRRVRERLAGADGAFVLRSELGTSAPLADKLVARGLFDDEVDLDYLEEEISRYYSNIVGKYGQPAQTALKKLGGLPIKMVCATHGPIRRSHIADIVAKYDKWSKYETDKGVVILFSSMYGNTENMADMIARFLVAKGIRKIRIHDTSKTHPSYMINDIFRFRGVIFGSCAYNGGIFPTMETMLSELEHMGVKNHVTAFFGDKMWSGGSMPRFNQFAEKMKWEVVAPAAEAWGAPKDADLEQCRQIAEAMAAKLDELYK